jgi:hypothetical protein
MRNVLSWIVLTLCAFSAKAQVSTISNHAPLLFEKAYLHTDRDVYAMGDTLWFKAYLVNGQDHKPALSSGNLYVELISPDSAKIVLREIIRMDNGLGHGDMALDDSLKSGHYTLRAYTNWMRNFGDNFVFEKDITLLDIAAVPAAPDPKAAVKNKKSAAATAAAAPNTAANILPIVRFYPEGGSLVNGIGSFVGVKAEDGYGKGIAAAGAVISASGDTVSHFNCDSLGIGVFTLLPLVGQSYQATVDLGSRHDVFQLPAALSKGLALQIRQTDSVIHALVRAAGTGADSTISMVVKHTGKTVLSQRFSLKDAQVAFKISTASLPEGISAITIYNQQNKPECERLVYVHHLNQNNKNSVSIVTDKKSYQPKEKASITIQAQPNSNLSMAAVDAGVVPVQTEDIVSYLNLQSELRGTIESPNRYFDTTNVNRFKQLDQLLLTQGWRDFVWRRMADTSIRISYAAENGIPVPGRMWEEVRNKMLPDLNISLHADSARGTKLFSARTDSAGRFYFDGLMLYGNQRIQLSATDDKGKDRGSFWLDTIRPLPVSPIIQRPAFMQNPLDSIAKVNTEKKVESMKSANLNGVTRLKEVKIKDRKTIVTRSSSVLTTWGPDQVFNITPNDYQYKTLEWFLLQTSKGAMKPMYDPNRRISPIHRPGVANEEFNREQMEFMRPLTGVAYAGMDTFLVKTPGMQQPAYSWQARNKLIPPILIVNGQELYMDNYEQAEAYRTTYFNMPMNKFKKVVLKHMIGTLHGGETPILPTDSKSYSLGQIETIPVDRYLLYLTLTDNAMIDNPGFLITNIPGYYQARTFYEPPPNAKPSIADYRSTIHWQPDIKTDATGKATVSFYNTLPSTDIRIIVQGISPEGNLLSNSAIYTVSGHP